jgi:Tol biopolymer transport system component/tRNA A-37 threonylcarbamoyl transferase component Bud32
MNPERQREVDDILAVVLARAPADRPELLSLICGADAGLRRELEALVLARERGDDLPETLDIGPQPGAPATGAPREDAPTSGAPGTDAPTLQSGASLGPYQVLERLGTGGMGQVYRAHDPRLRREVAIKVLSHHRLADPEARHRFEREARAAGALNHSNILVVYDVGVQDGVPYVVTELLEGETVRQRLARGPMPPGDCLQAARQIAEGLAAAHGKGILHRDLKPANLFLTRDGRTKILDFGMAKQLATGLEEGITTAATLPGTVLGTVGYMSPEQIRGQELDPRSDLFSFGAVLYEMLAGGCAFAGASAVEIMIAVLSDEAPPLPAALQVPAALEQLVRHCLQKDPAARPRDAGELCAALRELSLAGQDGAAAQDMARAPQGRAASRDAMGTGQGGAPAGGAGVSGAMTGTTPVPAPRAPVQAAQRRLRLAAAIVAVLAAGAAVALLLRSSSTAAKTGPQRVSYLSLTAGEGKETFPSLHPNGDLFAYAKWIGGRSHILLQRVGDTNPLKDLSESSPADDTQPAFSPDGARIAFRSERDGGGIFVMGATGELVRRLTHFGYNPVWSPDGQELLVATVSAENPMRHPALVSMLYRVKADGSGSRLISAGDALQPTWSPHGTRIAYWGVPPSGRREIWTVSAGGGEPVRVTDDDNLNWSPAWLPDGKYLYFSSNRSGLQSLWRVRIDESSGRLLEEPEEVATPSSFSGLLSFSRDGRNMIYASNEHRSSLERQAFDPRTEALAGGARDPIAGNLHEVLTASLSPDGQQIAYSSSGRHEDVFIVHVDGSHRRRLTADAWMNRVPVWSGDGSAILIYSNRGSRHGGKYEAWAIHLSGEIEQLTAVPDQGVYDPVAAPDGSLLACNLEKSGPALFRLALPLSRRAPLPLPAMSGGGSFTVCSWSPDGRQLGGFDSEGHLVTYSLATRTFQKLDARGTLPTWLHDNRRLIFGAKGGIYLVDATRSPGSTGRLLLAPAAGLTFRPIGLSPDDHWLYLLSSTEEGHVYLRSSN